MLKRKQVLLENWMIDYLKEITKTYEISFSESIRLLVSLQIVEIAKATNKNFKTKDFIKKISNVTEDYAKKDQCPEKLHNFISEVYFEGRKAAEIRTKQLKTLKKAK